MNLLSRIRSWTNSLVRRSRVESEMDAELRSHIEAYADDLIRSGVPREEALRQARLEFGGIQRVKEECRESRGITFIETLRQDIRYGFRTLRKSPSFTLVTVLTLALGIGANAAIFSVLNGVLLKMLPVGEPARLVQLEETYQGDAFNFFSYASYVHLRDDNHVFSDLFAWANRPMNLSTHDDVEPIKGLFVTGNYFAGLEVSSLIGRTIQPSDDKPESTPVAVLSYSAWQGRFGADPGAIGQTIVLERVPVTIVGVAPPSFFGAEVGHSFDIAVPLSLQPRLNPDRPFLARVDAQWLRVMARLGSGVSQQQARAQCTVLWPQILREIDPKHIYGAHKFGIQLDPASTGLSQLRDDYSRPLFILLGIAGFVLLIACGNVANLLSARARARERELAVRFALGASRWRITRQMLTECMLLCALGSASGLLLASWGARALIRLLSVTGLHTVTLDISFDGRVLLFAASVGLVALLASGVIPALKASSAGMQSSLRGGQFLTGRTQRLNRGLVSAQVALSLPLLLGASLFVRSLHNVLAVDTGFNREGVLMAHINPARAGYSGDRLASLYQQVLERLQSEPGVHAATLSTYPPLTGGGGTFFSVSNMSIDGHPIPTTKDGNVYLNVIAPDFFETLGIPFLSGRDFSRFDNARAPRVVIISEALATQFFPHENPIGHTIQVTETEAEKNVPPPPDSEPAEIVGVVKTMKYETLRESPHYIVFETYAQDIQNSGSVYVEARVADVARMTSLVREEVAGVARQVPIDDTVTLNDWMNQFLVRDKLMAAFAGGFGVLATLLAAVGLYGLVAYAVGQRTREIAVRIAFGAKRADVLRLFLHDAGLFVLIGVAVGIPLALALARLLVHLLFEVSPFDLRTMLFAVGILIATALAAAYIPGRRATRVDPVNALRCE
jgi:predicted permease